LDETALAEELRSCIGYGATAHKVVTLPGLASLVNTKDASPRIMGEAIICEIVEGINRLNGEYHIPGFRQALPGEQMQRSLKILLCLTRDSKAQTAPTRRARVIELLKLPPSVEQWRKGPEYQLMLILARHFKTGPRDPAIKLHQRIDATAEIAHKLVENYSHGDYSFYLVERLVTEWRNRFEALADTAEHLSDAVGYFIENADKLLSPPWRKGHKSAP
jgi:hypothetical protein